MQRVTIARRSEPGAPPLLLTPEQAASALSISRTRIFELFRDGQLPVVKLGRTTRVRVSDLESFVSSLAAQRR